MRIRATAAASLGALALTVLAVPAAHAATAATPAVTFSAMKVNSGKAVTVAATGTVRLPVTYTVTHPAGTSLAAVQNGPLIYRGTSPQNYTTRIISDDPGTCTTTSSTALSCKATISVPAAELYNSDAGTWKAGGVAINTKTGAQKWQGDLGTLSVRRAAKLTADATPEPVKKGRTITVTGRLTRADWEKGTYAGFGSQSVKLQFRKSGTSAYTTLKTIRTTSTGALRTTVTASADGYFRYTFAGTTTTAPVTSATDFVDVR
ncbi:hypothetical protein AB0F77_23815 [Streptomyces sp. NPDC026672]|uniref:hypothetical protein n=1 Tax=unclassified Streptomyces TaxID=2593676 RepID=UPI0033C8244A